MDLQKIRKDIDEIDDNIAELLDLRGKKVLELKKIKKIKKMKIVDTKREKEILERFKGDYKKNVFKKIIDESRKLQDE